MPDLLSATTLIVFAVAPDIAPLFGTADAVNLTEPLLADFHTHVALNVDPDPDAANDRQPGIQIFEALNVIGEATVTVVLN